MQTTKIGEGAYGIVYKTRDSHEEYVIKRNLIQDIVSFNSSSLELDMLVKLRGHPNIVTLKGIIYNKLDILNSPTKINEIKNGFRDNEMHFTFEIADGDLYPYIGKLKYTEIKYLLFDLLVGLEFIHNNRILHRDIKPGNLLIFSDINPNIKPAGRKYLKICDFGLSKNMLNGEATTPNIVTSWYRAPECMYGLGYNEALDIWSVGVIIYELFSGEALCKDAENSPEQICRFLAGGLPKESFKDLQAGHPWRNYGYELGIAKETFISRLKINPVQFDQELKCSPYNFIDLLISILNVTASSRPSIKQILSHDMFRDIPYQPFMMNLPKVYQIVSDKQRIEMYDTLIGISLAKEKLAWYTDRIIFMAASIVDRYIYWKIANGLPDHSDHGLSLRLLCMIYLSLKYLNSLSTPPSFDEFVEPGYRTVEYFDFAKEFEAMLITSILKNETYIDNLYEELYPKIEIVPALTFLRNVDKFTGTIQELKLLYQKVTM